MRKFLRYLAVFVGFFAAGAGASAIAGNVGPMMVQLYGADIDNLALFQTNIGLGAAGKLAIGAGLSNQAGALTASVQTVFGRTGTVTLLSSDVTGALGFTPANKGGDTFTGLMGFTTTPSATAAGSSLATATAITTQVTVFTSVAAGTGTTLNATTGVAQTLYNRGANVLTVYPPSTSAQIESYGNGTGVTIAVGGSANFRCLTTSQCYVGM